MTSDASPDPDPTFRGDARYEPRAFLGSGGSGSVQRVFDRELGIEVALKTPRAEELHRLKDEFRSLAGIVHPNLVQLHDLVVRDDACFFTMELVDGLDFVEHVRRGAEGSLDAAGLRRFSDAAIQLARGLAALHTAGRLHRDIKPANVRVCADGRVVILDFDLAAPLGEVGVQERAAGVLAGTYAYMPYEQFWGGEVGPPADWYALGVVFHEALTGHHPFGGGEPPAPDSAPDGVALPHWDRSLPHALRRIVATMLDPDPDKRADAEEILALLGAHRTRDVVPAGGGEPHAAFVGRARERTRLRTRFLATGGPRVVGISGVSGIGKSELAHRFLADLEQSGEAVALTGRCHPQESVPFKALDPIIDALARHLLEQDAERLEELLPENVQFAARLFPVLTRVPGLTGRGEDADLDIMELRRRGMGAIRELLRRLSRTTELVVWIDDAQWSDADSAELLGDLLIPVVGPPLFLLLTHRPGPPGSIRLLERMRELARDFSEFALEELELGPLASGEALELARQTWPVDISPAQRESLVAEAEGSPFLLGEMMRHLRTRRARGHDEDMLDLRQVIGERLLELGQDERKLLELVSVGGRPIRRAVVLEASGLGVAGRPVLDRLEGVGLLRASPLGREQEVEAYHDRIRESVEAQLAPEALAARHGALANALEATGRAQPDVLAHHFHGAGDYARAADYAVTAARRAASALAFVRSAELYRQARAWGRNAPEEERALLVDEADALVKGARLVQGGQLFLEAAAAAPPVEALELRRRAAEAMVGADVDVGLGMLEVLLRDLGLRYPRTSQGALLSAIGRFLWIALRGFSKPRPEREIDAAEKIRIDLCYAVGVRLVSADSGRGIYFSVRSLERALRSGDPLRTARSLIAVGGSMAVIGGPIGRIGLRMVETAEKIAEPVGSPPLNGTIDVGLAQVLMLEGRCREAVERTDRGVRILSEQCQGYAFECNFGRTTALRALEEIGRLDEVGQRAQELRDAADADGNRYAEAVACHHVAISRIAAGDCGRARELARRGLELWTTRDFHMQHFYGERILALCDLYEGKPEVGWQRLRTVEPGLQRSGLLRIPLIRVDAATLDAQLAFAAAGRDEASRTEWIQRGKKALALLAREERADARLHAALLSAGLAALDGRRDEALSQLERAATIGEEADLSLRALCARLRAAQIRDDAPGRDDLVERIRECGVADPLRWADIWVPGSAAAAPA